MSFGIRERHPPGGIKLTPTIGENMEQRELSYPADGTGTIALKKTILVLSS